MGGKRTRSSAAEDAVGEPEVCEYEQERQANIAENERRMAALGLLESVEALHHSGRAKKVPRKNPSFKQLVAPLPARRSSRLQGTPVPTYKELSEREINRTRQSRQTSTKREREVPEGTQPEYYTEEHEKLLGSYEQEWELTLDGYNPDRKTRIYDPVNGKTCHQCRQKTLGLRTWCSHCEALQGQFCGDCLFTRYGENILETRKNEKWVCPVCRGICNCSFCRPKRGWAPTGMLYRLAKALGYKSVAHYLIYTRRAPPTVPKEVPGVTDSKPKLSAEEGSAEEEEGSAEEEEGSAEEEEGSAEEEEGSAEEVEGSAEEEEGSAEEEEGSAEQEEGSVEEEEGSAEEEEGSIEEDSAEGNSANEHFSEQHCRAKISTGVDESARAPTRQSLSFSSGLPSLSKKSRSISVA